MWSRSGVRNFFFKALGRIGYRRAVFRECLLDEPLPEVSPRIPLVFELLDDSQISDYNAFRRGADPLAAARRLRTGDRCFVARHDGHIVGTCWSATKNAWSQYLSREIPIGPDECYTYDAFTAEDHRGQGVLAALTSEMHRFHRSAGLRREVAVTVPENKAAMNANIGYRSCGTIGYVRVGPFRRDFIRSNRKSGTSGEFRQRETTEPARVAESWDRAIESLEASGYYLDEFLANLKRTAYLALIERWGGVPNAGRVLKTDLFEEAMGPDAFLEELSSPGTLVLGMDVSPQAASSARRRDTQRRARYLAADACNLPVATASIKLIISPSTLDHFRDPSDLGRSLREFTRVLEPDGRLIITLDNRQNVFDPVLRLANRLGFVPYYLGRSYSVKELRRELEAAGLSVLDTSAIVHHPRLTAVAAVSVARQLPGSLPRRMVQSALLATQRLQDTRLQYLSGCFVAALAVPRNGKEEQQA